MKTNFSKINRHERVNSASTLLRHNNNNEAGERVRFMNLINYKSQTANEILTKKAKEFQNLKSGERHTKLYGLAMAAYYAGYDTQDSLQAYLLGVYDQCVGGADIADVTATVKKIISNAGISQSEIGTATNKTPKKMTDAKKIAEVHTPFWQKWSEEILKSSLNIPFVDNVPKADLDAARVEVVESILGDMHDSFFFVGNKKSDKQDNSYIANGYNASILELSPLYCPNPLTEKMRKKEKCKHVNYLVLEMDEAMAPLKAAANSDAGMEEFLNQQIKLWIYLKNKLPVKSLVYSGNKSIHALIAVDTTVEELDAKRQELINVYSELHFDTANIDAVRKTRMPFGIRYFAEGENGTLQDIDNAKYLAKLASGFGLEAKTARDKLAEMQIDVKNMKIVARLQDCLFWEHDIEHISLDKYINKLQDIVNEFLPSSENKFEQALERHEFLPMTQKNFEDYLKFKNYKIYTDEITRMPMFQGFPIDNPNTVTNQILDDWHALANKFPAAEKVKLCVDQALAANHINSVLEWLENIEWDGTSCLDTIFEILHLHDDLSKTLLKKWLVQCVAMLENGKDNQYGIDGVLTLIGKQGDGKTSFFRKLVPTGKQKDWFAEGRSLDTENTDSRRQLTKGWIMELGEVDSTTKKEQSSLKALLTASVDEIRKPYQVYAETTYRHVSICASVNKEEYLRDETGNRRWWSVKISEPIALDSMNKLDIEQLWAEIKHIWDNSDKEKQDAFRLSGEERILLEERNKEQREDAGYEDRIRFKFNFEADKSAWKWLTLEQIASMLLEGNVNRTEKTVINRSLIALKLEHKKPHNIQQYLLPPLR